jgi:D-alanyl-lipoteichoic acid acyltransferase DltB (MBOAT superfamily)
MSFNSFAFLAILPLVAAGYHLIRCQLGWPWSQAFLLAASLLFYVYPRPSNLPLLLGSILFNWAIARAMWRQREPRHRKVLLWVGVIANISLLLVCKRPDLVFKAIPLLHGPHVAAANWPLPLGVSFFTFTQIMYLIDAYPSPPTSPAALRIYQGLLRPNSLFEHATFVSLFPYVVSGPLVKARSVVPQLRMNTMAEPPLYLACRGIFLVALGLAKKVVLGDAFATIADAGFGAPRDFTMAEAWVFCSAALLHLYFDFSGYSDMAVGAAWMLGIDIPQNFNAPLRARSITEFWQRWHISLSNFITDYLYKPMLRLMPRRSVAASALATVLSMVIAGLWHGPTWTFVAWGLLHGTALAVNQVWSRRNIRMPNGLGWLLTTMFVTSTIVFLRAADLGEALHMLTRLAPHENPLGMAALRNHLVFTPTLILRPVVVGAFAAYLFKSSKEYSKRFRPTFATAAASAALIVVSALFMNSAPARVFVYFGF